MQLCGNVSRAPSAFTVGYTSAALLNAQWTCLENRPLAAPTIDSDQLDQLDEQPGHSDLERLVFIQFPELTTEKGARKGSS